MEYQMSKVNEHSDPVWVTNDKHRVLVFVDQFPVWEHLRAHETLIRLPRCGVSCRGQQPTAFNLLRYGHLD